MRTRTALRPKDSAGQGSEGEGECDRTNGGQAEASQRDRPVGREGRGHYEHARANDRSEDEGGGENQSESRPISTVAAIDRGASPMRITRPAVGSDVIEARECDFVRRALTAWAAHPAIEVLGSHDPERLSIVSFAIHTPSGRYLHHNAGVAMLNDLFGIQSRGGCSCAGPYGHRLLGIDTSHEFTREVALGCEGIKPWSSSRRSNGQNLWMCFGSGPSSRRVDPHR